MNLASNDEKNAQSSINIGVLMISAYEIFRHAVGLCLCFSAVLWVYLIAGDANIFLLVFGVIFGSLVAVTSYLLMFFWSDFDRISNYIFGSKTIPVHELFTLKTIFIFIVVFSFYSLIIFSFFQPRGVFLIFHFFIHIGLGIAPILSVYSFLANGVKVSGEALEGTGTIFDIVLLIFYKLGFSIRNFSYVFHILIMSLISISAPLLVGHTYSVIEGFDEGSNVIINYLVVFTLILFSTLANVGIGSILQLSKRSQTVEE